MSDWIKIVALSALIMCAYSSLARAGDLGAHDLPGGMDYVQALRTADEFLEAWANRDEKRGLGLISKRLRETSSEDDLRTYISGLSNPENTSFAIGAGKNIGEGFRFPVTLYVYYFGDEMAFSYQSCISIINQNGMWLVDKLPAAYNPVN